MKSAKEMFEDLGYEYKYLNSVIRYTKNDGGYVQQIIFYEFGHRIRFREWEEYNNFEPQGQSTIYIEHLQAINKQVEELGWK